MRLAFCAALIIALLGAFYLEAEGQDLVVTYDCEIPEIGEAVRAWAEHSAIKDGGCSESPDIVFEFFTNDIGVQCQTGVHADWSLIGCNRTWYETSADPYAALLHEVGHTLGLGHYGDCNSAPSVMGCWPIGELTAMDIAAIQYVWGLPNVEPLTRTYRVTVPMVSSP